MHKIARSLFIFVLGLTAALTCLCSLTGCADLFAEKPTEIQSENILRDLSRIRVLPDTNVVEPRLFTEPPLILPDHNNVKLFYIVRNHPVSEIAALLAEQYGYSTSINPATKQPVVTGWPVSINPATNQLIIKCKTEADANSALEFLQQVDVPPLQVHIDCIVSEVFADSTMDWETTLMISNLFGEGITMGGKKDAAGNVLPAFPGASLRDATRSQMGLKVGIQKDNFLALVDMLVSRGYLKIMMSPSLDVVNGKTATIESSAKQPLQTVVTSAQQLPYNVTAYYDVVDSLMITPHVFADGYIGLETKIVLGSSSTPQGVSQIPIITKQEIDNKENRIRQGESLVIGGIKKTIKQSVVRGVPFLKDIPLLGILFSSKDSEDQATEVLFIITPTISGGGVQQARMMQQLAKKHEAATYKETWTEMLLDPLGIEQHKEQELRQAEQTEDQRIAAERAAIRAEKAQAEAQRLKVLAEQAAIEKNKAEQAKAQAAIKLAEADRVKAQAAEAQAEAAKAAAEAEKVKGQADQAKAQAAAQEAERLSAEAKRKAAEAESAKAAADKEMAASKERAAKAEADKAQAEAEASKAQIEAAKIRAEAQKAAADAASEQARIEAMRAAAKQKQREPNSPTAIPVKDANDRSGPGVNDSNTK